MHLAKRRKKEWDYRNRQDSTLKYKKPVTSLFPSIVAPDIKDWGLIFDEDKYIQLGCIDRTGILKATYHLCLIRFINQYSIKDYYTGESFDPNDKVSPIIEIRREIIDKYSGIELAEKLLKDMGNSIVIVHRKNSRGIPIDIDKNINTNLWKKMALFVEKIDPNSMLAIEGVHSVDDRMEKLFKEYGITLNKSTFFKVIYRKFLYHLSKKYNEKCPCGKEINNNDETFIARKQAYINKPDTFEMAWDEKSIFVMHESCGAGGIGNSTGNQRSDAPEITYKMNLTDKEIAYMGLTKEEYNKHKVTWDENIEENFFEGILDNDTPKIEDPIVEIVKHQFDTPLNIRNLIKDCNLKTVNLIIRRKSQKVDPYPRDKALSILYKELIPNCQNPNCNKLLYIMDKNKNLYYVGDTHHVIWRSKGGLDVIGNIAVLCPSCHRNVHVCDWEQITEEDLKFIAKNNVDLLVSKHGFEKIKRWMPI